MSQGPLIVQSDRTVLLETDHADATTARHELAIFAELERSRAHSHISDNQTRSLER
jgi:DNA excision repair protein ERCC-3